MTNSVSSIYTAVTTGFTGTFDAYMGIAVAILTVSVGLALAYRFMPKRKKVM